MLKETPMAEDVENKAVLVGAEPPAADIFAYIRESMRAILQA